MLNQLKNSQGDTNDRFDLLLAEIRRTNDLLQLVVEQRQT